MAESELYIYSQPYISTCPLTQNLLVGGGGQLRIRQEAPEDARHDVRELPDDADSAAGGGEEDLHAPRAEGHAQTPRVQSGGERAARRGGEAKKTVDGGEQEVLADEHRELADDERAPGEGEDEDEGDEGEEEAEEKDIIV